MERKRYLSELKQVIIASPCKLWRSGNSIHRQRFMPGARWPPAANAMEEPRSLRRNLLLQTEGEKNPPHLVHRVLPLPSWKCSFSVRARRRHRGADEVKRTSCPDRCWADPLTPPTAVILEGGWTWNTVEQWLKFFFLHFGKFYEHIGSLLKLYRHSFFFFFWFFLLC